MIDKEKLKKEYENNFEKLKNELGFNVSLEDLEKEFFIFDSICEQGFLRDSLEVQICSRIVDYFRNWAGYLNNLLFPSSGNYSNQVESKLFSSEADKKEMWEIIKICMDFSSMYSFMFLSQDKNKVSRFIDDSFEVWSKKVRPYMVRIIGRVNLAWKENK